MKQMLTILWVSCVAAVQASAPPAFMGDWEGRIIDAPTGSSWQNNPSVVAKVVGLGRDVFEVQLMNACERRADCYLKETVPLKDGKLAYEGTAGSFMLDGDSFSGTLIAKRKGKPETGTFELKKTVRVSPTMGRLPPSGADVLIGNGSMDAWQHDSGNPSKWKLIDGDVLEIVPRVKGGGSLLSRKKYKDCEVHLEFRVPYEPGLKGQGRGNSGLFLQGVYEVQILDSYGFDAGWSDCGALYRVSPAKVNRCRPPGEWQTYDITFRAARFDAAGTLIRHPTITVFHNGELIHREQEIFEVPQFVEVERRRSHKSGAEPFMLQDHGHPVQFRNMWVLNNAVESGVPVVLGAGGHADAAH